MRYIFVRDLLAAWNLNHEKVLFCDSRDVVFQSDPFAGEWPSLWTCEEDRKIEDCQLNKLWLERTVGKAAILDAKQHLIVCSGITGGQASHLARYLQRSSQLIEQAASRIALVDVGDDQGIHNYLARVQPQLGLTVLPNGSPAANVHYTIPADIKIIHNKAYLRERMPAILHQYDRHPILSAMVQSIWASSKCSDCK